MSTPLNNTARNTADRPLHEILFQYFYTIPVILSLTYVVYQRWLSPLAKIPGPIWASLSRWWLVRVSLSDNYNREMMRLHRNYGDIVRVGPDEVYDKGPTSMYRAD